MKVLHLPTTVGGNPNQLSYSLRKLGVDSKTLAINTNSYVYPTDRYITKPTDSRLIRIIKQIWASKYVFGDYDIIHFNSGSTLFSTRFHGHSNTLGLMLHRIFNGLLETLQLAELSILKLRKIPIFVHYQGDDARQGQFSLQNYRVSIASEVGDNYYSSESDKHKKSQIRLLDKFAAKIYALNPDLLDVLPKRAEFIAYNHVDPEVWEGPSGAPKGSLTILHAPSDRRVKGTRLILDSLEKLKQEGFEFEVIIVEGLAHAEAKKVYEQCDLVIDQIYAGWYGGLAVECMALGKPVMAYIRDSDLEKIPVQMAQSLPVIRTSKDTLTQDLREVLLLGPSKLGEIAASGVVFVKQWHNPEKIARKILEDYRDAISNNKN
jgi:hypothetical protein